MITLIDSGVGGLTVLRGIKKLQPALKTIYIADNQHFPYGTKSTEEIQEAIKYCLKGIKTFEVERVFIACHTASIALEGHGLELELITEVTKKMIESTDPHKTVAVLGSCSTIESDYYQNHLYKSGFKSVRGFALQEVIHLIEKGVEDEDHFLPYLSEIISYSPDILLLASTHFPHIKELFAKLFPHAKILDPSEKFAIDIVGASGVISDGDLSEDLFITTKHDPKFLTILQKNPINNLLKKGVGRV
jgi:glutamate racemase